MVYLTIAIYPIQKRKVSLILFPALAGRRQMLWSLQWLFCVCHVYISTHPLVRIWLGETDESTNLFMSSLDPFATRALARTSITFLQAS